MDSASASAVAHPRAGHLASECTTSKHACDATSLNKLSTSTELVKSELVTSDELVKSELVKSEEPVKGGEFVTSGVYTNRFGFETNVV